MNKLTKFYLLSVPLQPRQTSMRLLPRVLSTIQRAKASHAQLPNMPLRRDTQALRLIASIPLIQRREKQCFREEKSAFTQWFSSVYVRSLKDQVRKSKYPRTQILEPRTQSKLFCHSSATFIPTQSNNLIQVTSQSYIGIQVKLYRNQSKAIQLSSPSYYSSTHVLLSIMTMMIPPMRGIAFGLQHSCGALI